MNYAHHRLVSALLTIVFASATVFAQDSLGVSRLGSLYHFWDTPQDLQVLDNYAYVATGYSGLRVLSIADASNLSEFSFLETPGFAQCVAIESGVAFVADGDAGVRIISIDDPHHPREISFALAAGPVTRVAIDAPYMYAAGDFGFRVFDIANIESPVAVGNWTASEGAGINDIAIEATYVVLAETGGIRIMDRDPISPTPIAFFPLEYGADAIVIRDTLAYTVALGGGLRIFSLGTPALPTEIGADTSYPFLHDLAVFNEFVYAVTGWFSGGLRVYNISSVQSPFEVGHNDTLPPAMAISVTGNDAYLAETSQGFRSVDLADPGLPRTLGRFASPQILNVALTDSLAVLGLSPGGIRIVSIANPTEPFQIASSDSLYDITGITIQDSLVFVSAGIAGLRIKTISPDGQLADIGGWVSEDSASVSDAAIVGNTAYLISYFVDSIDRIRVDILDVSNPAHPISEGTWTDLGRPAEIKVLGNYAYVVDWLMGLRIFDVTDIHNPIQVGVFDTADLYYDVSIQGDLAYLATSIGLRIVDIANPTNPTQLTADSTLGFAVGIDLAGSHVLLSVYDKGLAIVDVSNPTIPRRVGWYDTPGRAWGIAHAQNLVCVADYTNFGIYDCAQALPAGPVRSESPRNPFSLSPCSPNPFNAETTISYTLPIAGTVTIGLYDILGRQVKLLSNTFQLSGQHRLTIDGTDLASGLYFIRLVAGELQSQQRALLLR